MCMIRCVGVLSELSVREWAGGLPLKCWSSHDTGKESNPRTGEGLPC